MPPTSGWRRRCCCRRTRRTPTRTIRWWPARCAITSRLGAALAEHVRLEEHELFPLVESAMPAEALAAVSAALEWAEASGTTANQGEHPAGRTGE